MRATAKCFIGVITIFLCACNGGAIGSNASSSHDSGAPLPQSQGDGGGGGPEVCGDGLDNNGNGEVDEVCGCDPIGPSSQACYPGPAATRNVGRCKDGNQQCETNDEFSGWGACQGAVLPGVEVCGDGVDDDCNGKVDDGPGCVCQDGESQSCYSGPKGTDGVGACKAGTQKCSVAGLGWEACVGEVLPQKEACDDGIDNDCDGLVDEGCTSQQAPQVCTLANLTHIVGSGDCGAHSAVYMMDDGVGPNFICCPLPATDILTSAPATVSAAGCGADVVIVGAVSALTFKCKKINTTRYRLQAAQKPCYFGSGWSGGSGVSKCQSHPATFSTLQQNKFGSDGCSGMPYGALFVQQQGKDCDEMAARQLVYTGKVQGDPPGAPVVMFH